MKKLVASAAVALDLFATSAVRADQRTVTLGVDNMACVVCALNVKRSLERVAGVLKVDVSLKQKIAVVVYDDATADLKALTAATARAGFPSAPKN